MKKWNGERRKGKVMIGESRNGRAWQGVEKKIIKKWCR